MAVRILIGDCRERLGELPDASVNCCVTSPPYFGLRDYGHEGQMGLEPTPDEFVAGMVEVFREVRRVLRDDGTLWLNIGDSYSSGGGDTYTGFNARYDGTGIDGGKQAQTAKHFKKVGDKSLAPKNLIGVPWRLAFALQSDGWILRQDIIWSKPNPMPESVRDRCTKAHEYLFLLSKGPKYFYDADAIREPNISLEATQARSNQHNKGDKYEARPDLGGGDGRSRLDFFNEAGRNKRSVWTVTPEPFPGAHFATYPPALIEPCVLAGCPKGGTVLDPFGGAGTTGLVADRLQRDAILIELNPEYAEIARKRLQGDGGMFSEVLAA